MTSSERGIMAHVLQMAAFEVRDPIQAFVQVEAHNLSRLARKLSLSFHSQNPLVLKIYPYLGFSSYTGRNYFRRNVGKCRDATSNLLAVCAKA